MAGEIDNGAVRRAESRLEIVTGLVLALDRRRDVDSAVEEAEDRADALRRLTGAPLEFTVAQAHSILDTTLGRRTRLARQELRREQQHLEAELEGLQSGASTD